MGKILLWFLSAIETKIGSIVVSALLALGVGFTTFKFSVQPFENFIRGQAGGIGGQAVAVLGFLGFDQAITIILSAIAARYAVQGARAVLKGAAAAAGK